MSTTYNGWANYETWNVKLWIDNDHGLYSDFNDYARDLLTDEEGDKEAAASALARSLETFFDDNLPETEGVYADLLSAALGHVEWFEIAQHIIDDVFDDWRDENPVGNPCAWVAGSNMPGYMPDETPAGFDSFEDACESIAEEMERDADALEESHALPGEHPMTQLQEAASKLREYVEADAHEWGATIAGRHYFVTRGEG